MTGPSATSATRDIVVVGASAGGVEALRAMVQSLPGDLPAAVLVVLHIPPYSASALPAILHRAGKLPAAHAVDGEPLEPGRIYVAPPDSHLLVLDGRVRLSRGPHENGHRPAIDPLFRSAARSAGPRAIGVVLSGSRDDGTGGLATLVKRGGLGLVQEPGDALHTSMPRSALEHVPDALVASAAGLGDIIAARAGEVVDGSDTPPADALLVGETDMAEFDPVTSEDLPAHPAGLGCPSCHGALFELPGAPAPRYRCLVGHAWSPESLLDEQATALEGALWMALRSLEDKASLSRRMAEGARRRGQHAAAGRYDTNRSDATAAAGLIRDLISKIGNVVPPSPEVVDA